jgi:DNA-binding NarL/FixJ family response regulator
MTISVLLVDDHIIFREALAAFLMSITGFDVVGKTGDGNEALLLAEQLHPTVVVLDCVMPSMSGVEVARLLHETHPQIRVVMLSLFGDESYVSAAIQNGASGYILKEDTIRHLAQAVDAAVGGDIYLSPSLREARFVEIGHQ